MAMKNLSPFLTPYTLRDLGRACRLGAVLSVFGFANASVGVSHAGAQLSWERREVTLQGEGMQDTPVFEARFPFTNTGQAPVEIRSVQTSCGCTTAQLPKRRFEPGEHGEILARFEAGERVGRQEKTIAVETDDGAGGPTTLRLVAEIPEGARLRPAFVFWFRGEEPVPKTLTLESSADGAAGGMAPRLTGVRVESSIDSMKVETREVTPGQRWELTVHPAQMDQLVISTLRVVCRFEPAAAGGPGGGERTLKAYAAIKPTPVSDR